MQVESLEIEDVKLIKPAVYGDDRGYFCETYNQKRFEDALGPMTFVQDNQSFSKNQYTVRGLHYQAPPYAQDKLVRVLTGSILDVVVDVRKGSPTYGQWVSAELSAENHLQLLCPIGFLHGFMTLEDDTLVSYKVTNFYDKQSDGSVLWNSPSLGIDWPISTDAAQLSEKDLNADDFSVFQSPFA